MRFSADGCSRNLTTDDCEHVGRAPERSQVLNRSIGARPYEADGPDRLDAVRKLTSCCLGTDVLEPGRAQNDCVDRWHGTIVARCPAVLHLIVRVSALLELGHLSKR